MSSIVCHSESASQALRPTNSPEPRAGRKYRRLTIKNINGGIPAPPSMPNPEQVELDESCGQTGADDRSVYGSMHHESRGENGADNRSVHGSINHEPHGQTGADDASLHSMDIPASAIAALPIEHGLAAGLHQCSGAPVSQESTSDVEHGFADSNSASHVDDRETTFECPTSDVNQDCPLTALHALAKSCGLSEHQLWLCCSLILLQRVTSIMAMSLDGKRPLRVIDCIFCTSATVPILRETCARRLGWIPTADFSPDRYDLDDVSRRLQIVPIGSLKMPVRPRRKRLQCVVDFVVVEDKVDDMYDCIMSDKFIEDLHLHHRMPICPTRMFMTLSCMLRRAPIQNAG